MLLTTTTIQHDISLSLLLKDNNNDLCIGRVAISLTVDLVVNTDGNECIPSKLQNRREL